MTFGPKPGAIDRVWLFLVNLNSINDDTCPKNLPPLSVIQAVATKSGNSSFQTSFPIVDCENIGHDPDR